jgi:hypothetical protein
MEIFHYQAKGQVFSTDFVVSAAVFGLMASIFLFSWNTMVDQQVGNMNERDQYSEAQRTVNTLITRTSSNFTESEYAGLAAQPYVMNYSKIQQFRSLNDSVQASLLQTSNFSLEIKSGTDSLDIGYEPGGTYALPFRRNISMVKNGFKQDAEMELILWG